MARYGVSSGLLLTHGGKAHWLREKLQEKSPTSLHGQKVRLF